MKKKYQSHLIYSLLSKYYRLSSSKEAGYILVIAMGIILGITGLLALYAKTTKTDQITVTSTLDGNTGFYAAESGLNLRVEDIRQIFLNHNEPTGVSPSSPTACLDGDTSNDGTGHLKCKNYNFVGGNQNRSGHFATTYMVKKNNGLPTYGVVPPGDQFQNLNMIEYTYSLYSLAFKDTSTDSQAEAILQMDVKSRLIPMFQFTAFYKEDLEILPGPIMTLNGPVHTNGDLYLGGGNELNINGQVTTVGDIYNKRKNNNNTYPDGRVRIADATTTLLNLLFNGTGSITETTDAMDPLRIASTWGTQVQLGLDQIFIPEASFLDTSGDYYNQADIRIEFKPSATSNNPNMSYLEDVPFSLQVIPRTDSSGNEIISPTTNTFNEGQLRSLRQPIMVQPDLANIATSNYRLCQPLSYPSDYSGTFTTWWDSLTDSEKRYFAIAAQKSLQYVIQSQEKPVLYSLLSSESINSLNSYYTQFLTDFQATTATIYLNLSGSAANPSDINSKLSLLTPAQIAALPYNDISTNPVLPRCFVSAPITEVGRDNSSHQSPFRFHNERENREMRILQLNLQSLAVWNRDGIYFQFSSGTVTNHNNYDGFSANELLYTTATADATAPTDSFQSLGMAAIDNSQGGIVIHGTVDSSTYGSASGTNSPYAFAVVKAQQLFGLGTTTNNSNPTGITIASDQAVYIQGDYNTLNKQPAAVLGDVFTPLSNACLNSDHAINHNTGINCDIDGSKVNATDTTANLAILAGTDITTTGAYNGGLENYPRFLEDWTGSTWTYRGSFVSISAPLHSSGNWSYGGDIYTAPNRDWDYDGDFNNPINLPPLTPRFVALKQMSFIRSYEQ